MSPPPLHPSSPPLISLCIIAGNVERYISRFLDSFAPLVDEIVIASAIGSQPADKTSRLAFEHPKVAKQGIYNNTYVAGRGNWPHVDDFAAARNMAFDLASNDWILWADTDDIIDPASIAKIKEVFAAQHDHADCFSFEYHVPEDGLTVIKDRLVRKNLASWRYRVHEELVISGESPRFVVIDGARITHMPSGSRARNDERNLRLLEAMKADGTITPGHRFHLVNTLRAVGRPDDCVREAMELLKAPDLNTPERVELLMTLAQMCDDPRRQQQLFLQALVTDPTRREGYGELAVNACRTGQWKQMLAWTTAMLALPAPAEYTWNTRAQYYGWGGIRLHATALRLNGRRQTGDILQFNHFKKHGAKISLLHATRGRCKQALAAQMLWLNRAADADAIEHIFAVDADDEQAMPLAANLSVIVPPGGGCVRAWNAAAQKSRGQVLMQMSDDFEPPMHWDKIILERLGDLTRPAVLAVSDGFRTDDLLCMAILTRARYAQQGYLFHPDFKSMYSDNWFTRCAIRAGVIIDAKDVVFEHLHPAAGKAEMDKTYEDSNAPERYAQGYDILARLIAEEPPIPNP